MALNKLTLKKIDGAKPKEAKYEISDGGGLYLRIQPIKKQDGTDPAKKTLHTELPTRRWYFVYRSPELAGRQRWMDIGAYPDVPLYDDDQPENGARGKAAAARLQVASGIDPIEEVARQITKIEADKKIEAERFAAANLRPQTVEELFHTWKKATLITRRDDKGNITFEGRSDEGAEIERSFTKDVFPYIGKKHPNDVEEHHVHEIGDGIKQRGSMRQANVTLTNMRQMFSWGRRRKYVQEDPTEGIKKEEFGGAERSRERTFSDVEITELAKKLWHKVDGKRTLTRPTQMILLLQLATVCRIGELIASEWVNVNLELRTYFLPKAIRKSKRGKPAKDHSVHLSDFAIKVLTELKRFSGHTAWLMPSRQTSLIEWDGMPETKGKCIDEKTVTKQTGDRQRESALALAGRSKDCTALILSGGHWVPHDLRRTAATLIERLAVQEKFSALDAKSLARRCLSHFEPDKLNGTYLQYGYDEEMAKAWDHLGAHLAKLVPAYVLDPMPTAKKKKTPDWKHEEVRERVLGNLPKPGAVR